MFVDFNNFLQNMDFAQPSWDLFIVLFFVIGVFVYGFAMGKDRIVVTLVSIYVTLAVSSNLPIFNDRFSGLLAIEFAYRLISFFVLLAIVFLLLNRSGLIRAFSTGHSGFFQILIFSILHVGLTIAIALSFLPAENLNNFSPSIQYLFVGNTSRIVWLLAPLVAMALFRYKNE